LLYRWLVKNAPAVHAALDTINAGLAEYIRRALAEGVKIISLADPYANQRILGEKRYREFAAAYLIKLLKNIAAGVDASNATAKLNTSTVVNTSCKKSVRLHLCPHNSVPLVQAGYLEEKDIPITPCSYINALTDESIFPPGLTITGNRCIYSENTGTISVLNFL
jgi:hypothetical protein